MKPGTRSKAMMFSYPAALEPGESNEITVVTFPDVPEAITEGVGRTDALDQAAEALGLALLMYAKEDRPLPSPSLPKRREVLIGLDAETAAKLALIDAFRASGLTRSDLARRLGRDEKEVRRMLDPMHATKLSALRIALAELGRRLVIGVEPIAA